MKKSIFFLAALPEKRCANVNEPAHRLCADGRQSSTTRVVERGQTRPIRLLMVLCLVCSLSNSYTQFFTCGPDFDPACSICGNFISNGSFESNTGNPTGEFEIQLCYVVPNVCNWVAIAGSPDIFPTSISAGYDDGAVSAYNGVAFMRCLNTSYVGEGAATFLALPLEGGGNYQLSFAIRVLSSGSNPAYSMKFFLADAPLEVSNPTEGNPYIYDASTNWDFGGVFTSTGTPFGPLFYSTDVNNWQLLTVNFTCPPSMDGASIFGILPSPNQGSDNWVLFDSFSLIDTDVMQPSINLPEPLLLCDITILEDLQNYITLTAPGTEYEITGPGVVPQGNGVYDFDASLLSLQQLHDGVTITLENFSSVYSCDIITTDVLESCCQLTVDLIGATNCSLQPNSNEIQTIINDVNGTYVVSWIGPDNFTSNEEIIANLPQGSYEVTVSQDNDPLCYVIEEIYVGNNGWNPIPPPTYSISATETWTSGTYIMQDNLVLQAGVNFILDACTLRFVYGKGIILMPGADIEVKNNSLLTTIENCDNGFWSGISAQHGTNYDNTVDVSWVKVNTGSTIERAQTAIRLQTITGIPPYTSTAYWAKCMLNNATFLNNRIDLLVLGQEGALNHNIQLEAKDCLFLTNLDFGELVTPNPTKISIKRLAKPVRFIDCIMENTAAEFLTPFEFTAVELIDATAKIYSIHDDNLTGINHSSRIAGFTRGVKLTGTGTLTMYRTDLANWRDTYIRANGSHAIWDCDFYSLQPNILDNLQGNITLGNTTVNPITQEANQNDIINFTYGLYIDAAYSHYLVRDNEFDMTLPGYPFSKPWVHGCILNNTDQWNNRIRRNFFANNGKALKIQGDNRDFDKKLGVTYKCNDFTNNNTDIREVSSPYTAASTWGVMHQGIKDYQNTFTSEGCSFCEDDDIDNTTGNSHKYYRPLLGTEPDAAEIYGIQISENQGSEDCTLLNGLGNETNAVAIKGETEEQIALLSAWLIAVEDGGHTVDLTTLINNTNFANAATTYLALMAESPNLSERVLVEAVQNYHIPNVLLTEILASNPAAAQSTWLLTELGYRPIPLDSYQMDQVMNSQYLGSALEDLKTLIGEQKEIRSYATQSLIANIYEDETITNKRTAIEALLDEEIYHEDLLFKTELQMADGDYKAAVDMLTDEAANTELVPEMKKEVDGLLLVAQIQQEIKTSNATMLTTTQENALLAMLSEYPATAVEPALDLLIKYADFEYQEPIVDDEWVVKRENGNGGQLETTLYQVYPNPAENMIIVEAIHAGITHIELYDALGKMVISENVSKLAFQHAVMLAELSPGYYNLRLLDEAGKTLHHQPIVKK